MNGPGDGASLRRLAIAGAAGNILEWYDFSIYKETHRARLDE